MRLIYIYIWIKSRVLTRVRSRAHRLQHVLIVNTKQYFINLLYEGWLVITYSKISIIIIIITFITNIIIIEYIFITFLLNLH